MQEYTALNRTIRVTAYQEEDDVPLNVNYYVGPGGVCYVVEVLVGDHWTYTTILFNLALENSGFFEDTSKLPIPQ